MNYENLPRQILLVLGCLISGFLLAVWCLPLMDKKPRIANLKPGFSITFPTSLLRNPAETHKLIGKQVRLIRTPVNPQESCVIEHVPLMLQIHDQFVTLSAGFEGLENFIIHTSIGDLKAPDLSEFPSNNVQKHCRTHPKVTYGE